MPILPEAPRKPVDALRRLAQSIDYTANSAAVASLTVGFLAFLLAFVHIELQYVVGAVLIVYAQRLAMKRLSPTVLHVPEPQPKTPRSYREILDPRKPLGPSDEATA